MRAKSERGFLLLLALLLSLTVSAAAIDPLTLKAGVWNKTQYSCVIRSLLEDRHGTLWIGTFGAGLWRFDGQTVASVPANADGLPDSRISKLLLDGDRLFLQTAGILDHL
ncbi:MAG TPA: two-component regulator propeller domain-containing protein, partial [Candidatus Ozemobacteraceae bacterium]|nr:two-component regulator propeller domain-containing protein [Candidatus Ozemobacteraceae bacterium]